MGRRDVPVGIRRSVVQIQVERAVLQAVVRVATVIGDRALSPCYLHVVFNCSGGEGSSPEPPLRKVVYKKGTP